MALDSVSRLLLRKTLYQIRDMTLTKDNNESDTTFEDIISDILSQDNVMLSVKSAGAICEVNTEMNLPLHVSDQYATIGDETRPWHIHVNFLETKEARFVIENKTNGRNSYSIRFFDSKGNLVLRANFVRMYDSSNTLIQERFLAYEKIFAKYGKKQNLVLRATKEIEHY
jgi:putative heme iron utilization protein